VTVDERGLISASKTPLGVEGRGPVSRDGIPSIRLEPQADRYIHHGKVQGAGCIYPSKIPKVGANGPAGREEKAGGEV
jgi:hypothetical protein